jgi:hypothetical protein
MAEVKLIAQMEENLVRLVWWEKVIAHFGVALRFSKLIKMDAFKSIEGIFQCYFWFWGSQNGDQLSWSTLPLKFRKPEQELSPYTIFRSVQPPNESWSTWGRSQWYRVTYGVIPEHSTACKFTQQYFVKDKDNHSSTTSESERTSSLQQMCMVSSTLQWLSSVLNDFNIAPRNGYRIKTLWESWNATFLEKAINHFVIVGNALLVWLRACSFCIFVTSRFSIVKRLQHAQTLCACRKEGLNCIQTFVIKRTDFNKTYSMENIWTIIQELQLASYKHVSWSPE